MIEAASYYLSLGNCNDNAEQGVYNLYECTMKQDEAHSKLGSNSRISNINYTSKIKRFKFDMQHGTNKLEI